MVKKWHVIEFLFHRMVKVWSKGQRFLRIPGGKKSERNGRNGNPIPVTGMPNTVARFPPRPHAAHARHGPHAARPRLF